MGMLLRRHRDEPEPKRRPEHKPVEKTEQKETAKRGRPTKTK